MSTKNVHFLCLEPRETDKSFLKLSWNFLKSWSWKFTSCCWEPWYHISDHVSYQSQSQSVAVFQTCLQRLRTVNVDVDSRGRSCKERMMSVLCDECIIPRWLVLLNAPFRLSHLSYYLVIFSRYLTSTTKSFSSYFQETN